MKYDVTFTEQAENDLRGIFEYIAFDLLSPENAAGQLDRDPKKKILFPCRYIFGIPFLLRPQIPPAHKD